MAEAKNSFIKSKMNKDLDERLIPNNEYRDALNIAVSRSDAGDVGAVEAILGNSPTGLLSQQGFHIIGTYSDEANNRLYYFRTNYTKVAPAPLLVKCSIGYLDTLTQSNNILVVGSFLNFSTQSYVYGISLIENQLFFTDNRNQPRKINIDQPLGHYTNEDQISVAKFAPYFPPAFINLRSGASYFQDLGPVVPLKPSTMSDAQDPPIVEIGIYKLSQENLAVKKYRNGDEIPQSTLLIDWELADTNEEGRWCYYENYNGNGVTYGLLYNKWAVIDPRGLAPIGHRIPTLADWNGIFAVNSTSQANNYKSQFLWDNTDPTAIPGDNILGTSILPGGYRNTTTSPNLQGFLNLTTAARFWTSDEVDAAAPNDNPFIGFDFTNAINTTGIIPTVNGCSVRVLRDTNYTGWNGDPDFLSDKFARFSYRFKFEDNEYSTVAPFSQDVFIPYQEGEFVNQDENQAFITSVVEFMQNSINNAVLNIQLPCIDIINKYKISAIDIIFKQSDMQAYQVIETVKVDSNFISSLNYTNIYQYSYQSTIPVRTLPDVQSIRVFDKVPVKALAQETSGNRIMYSNYLEGYSAPVGLDYYVGVADKSQQQFIEYPQHSVKQNRNYQVGIVLSDKYGRHTDVVLSNYDGLLNANGEPQPGSNFYSNYNPVSFSNSLEAWTGDNLALYYLQQIPEGDIGVSGYPGAYAAGNYYEVDTETASAPSALYPYFLSIGTQCLIATDHQVSFDTIIVYADTQETQNTFNVLVDFGNGWILQDPTTYLVSSLPATGNTAVTFLPTLTAEVTNATGVPAVTYSLINLTPTSDKPIVGSLVSGVGITTGTLVSAYDENTGIVTLDISSTVADGVILSFSSGIEIGNVVKFEVLYTDKNYYKYSTGAGSSTVRPLFTDWPTAYAQYYSLGKKLKGLYIDYTEIKTLSTVSDSNGVRGVVFFTEEEVASNYLFNGAPVVRPEPSKFGEKNTYATYNINVNGFYIYKSVIKQQQQDFYNVYLPGIINGYPIVGETKEQNEIAFVTLVNDNINKIPRNLQSVGPSQEQFTSDVSMWPRVTNITEKSSTTIPYSTFNQQVDPEASSDKVDLIGTLRDLFPDLIPQSGTAPQPGEVNSNAIYSYQTKPYLAKVSVQKSVGLGESSYTLPGTGNGNYPYPANMGLAVYETTPFVSPLELFYESSTADLISELNLSIENENTNITGISAFEYTFLESMALGVQLTTDFFPVAAGVNLTNTTLLTFTCFSYYSTGPNQGSLDTTLPQTSRFIIAPGAQAGSFIIKTNDRFYAGSSQETATDVDYRGKFTFTLTFVQTDGLQVNQSLTLQLENVAPIVQNPYIQYPSGTITQASATIVVATPAGSIKESNRGQNGSARSLADGDLQPWNTTFTPLNFTSGWSIDRIVKIGNITGNIQIANADGTGSTNEGLVTNRIDDWVQVYNGTDNYPTFQDGIQGAATDEWSNFAINGKTNASGGMPGPLNEAGFSYDIYMNLRDTLQAQSLQVNGTNSAVISYTVGANNFVGQVLINGYYGGLQPNPGNNLIGQALQVTGSAVEEYNFQFQNWTTGKVYLYMDASISDAGGANVQCNAQISASFTGSGVYADDTGSFTDANNATYNILQQTTYSMTTNSGANSSQIAQGNSAGPIYRVNFAELQPFEASSGGVNPVNNDFNNLFNSGLNPGDSHDGATGVPAYDFSGCAVVNLKVRMNINNGSPTSQGIFNLYWSTSPQSSFTTGGANNSSEALLLNNLTAVIGNPSPPFFYATDGLANSYPTAGMGTSPSQFDGPNQ